MTAVQVNNEFFAYLSEYQLAICKECKHAVWPKQFKSHLTGKQHRMKEKKAIEIAQTVQSWSDLMDHPSQMEVPSYIERAISQLPLYQDGLLCQLDRTHCHYICRNLKTMKWHWRKAHAWSIGKKRGGSGQAKGKKIEARAQEAMKPVECQRFFPSRDGSQYFEVRQSELEQEQAKDEGSSGQEGGWTQLRKKLIVQRTTIEDKARSMIQEVLRISQPPLACGSATCLRLCGEVLLSDHLGLVPSSEGHIGPLLPTDSKQAFYIPNYYDI